MENEKVFVTKSSMPSYEEYAEAIKPLWDSCFLTNMGIYHQQLELELKKFLEVPELSLMVNGHMALEMAIQAFGFPAGSEVITTPFTFISTTHAIVRNRLKPVFCDIKLCDGTIDESKIEALVTPKTVAIIPVHVYGNICNVEGIKKIADKYNLKVIYDAAHAFGETYKGKGVGTFGDASAFSFHATKVFHTIEGGAVTFSDKSLYEKLYNLKNFGIRGEELVTEIGANAKMNEFSAIMGLCNLRHIEHVRKERQLRYLTYVSGLNGVKGIKTLDMSPEQTKNYGYFPIVIEDESKRNRNELYDWLKANQVYARKYFYPLSSDQTCFKNKYKNAKLENARRLSEKILILPLYETLELENIERILRLIR